MSCSFSLQHISFVCNLDVGGSTLFKWFQESHAANITNVFKTTSTLQDLVSGANTTLAATVKSKLLKPNSKLQEAIRVNAEYEGEWTDCQPHYYTTLSIFFALSLSCPSPTHISQYKMIPSLCPETPWGPLSILQKTPIIPCPVYLWSVLHGCASLCAVHRSVATVRLIV